ncbi:hypothetical protein WT60_13510 [Burkholderia sp. MSMB617WGS]|uniref:Uncharacterized protein n=1 Tax=Burkholderia savannae TaxID=1637837 RepID=A0ABR5TG19_9BURK|nr:hypothetical protein WS78_13240 [Burkholderia savannae]AOK47753.1 hypothetical protein WT60_13510 [Burkholderia sp. MSMB617WGS]KVG44439.1 hypothetical protein WS77_09045 [Burkholderia sp. MSMB0265]KVG82737.1 hypothetical protein WS81_09600 [Burkholderia sp. MSMB2040]KVH00447.1 hypothetical protein WS82_23135 [Burkholderia sp. MSMB2041]KVH01825.1 hypothetical protein WS83_17420 [Burkholderia sp. MSMB2042]KVK71636.1 hypothetical protein WS91_23755 [Burkholderia sp. MSMB1498]
MRRGARRSRRQRARAVDAPAIRFYEGIGASAQSEWVRYRLAGDALRAFASEAPADAAKEFEPDAA